MRVGMEEWGAWGGKEGGAIDLIIASPLKFIYQSSITPMTIFGKGACE